jgi:hypothetical protein
LRIRERSTLKGRVDSEECLVLWIRMRWRSQSTQYGSCLIMGGKRVFHWFTGDLLYDNGHSAAFFGCWIVVHLLAYSYLLVPALLFISVRLHALRSSPLLREHLADERDVRSLGLSLPLASYSRSSANGQPQHQPHSLPPQPLTFQTARFDRHLRPQLRHHVRSQRCSRGTARQSTRRSR